MNKFKTNNGSQKHEAESIWQVKHSKLQYKAQDKLTYSIGSVLIIISVIMTETMYYYD